MEGVIIGPERITMPATSVKASASSRTNQKHQPESNRQVEAERPTAVALTILYGTETGNAQQLAEQAAEQAQQRGLSARAIDMANYKPRELKAERLLMIVTATHGEGDPPEPAQPFHEFLHSRKAPALKHLRFAVLSLGDSSYEHFCQTGKDFDAQLETLGGTRLADRVDCDVDYEDAAEAWIEQSLARFAEIVEREPELRQGATPAVASEPAQAREAPAYDKKNPFPAEILENVRLTGRGSAKETRHVELSLEGSGLRFEPGDILCLAPRNRPEVVDALLAATGFSASELVDTRSGRMSLAEALAREYEITTLTPPFLKAYAQCGGHASLQALLEPSNREKLNDYIWGRHVIDVIEQFPVPDLEPRGFVEMLRRLPAREYSIASSFEANPDEVHLTVAAVRYHSHGRDRHGVASTYLADLTEPGTQIPVYVKPNKTFKLPADPDTPIIMIGPGTGVAPFRAFMQHREYDEARGRNWLFFGEQRFRTDFLYQTEWQAWLKQRLLHRIDLAFSRDQSQKVYVQDRMLERSRELFAWLEEGAHVYVCGDADRMAPDVHRALETIVHREGGVSAERATEYVKNLQREKRYQRDVY